MSAIDARFRESLCRAFICAANMATNLYEVRALQDYWATVSGTDYAIGNQDDPLFLKVRRTLEDKRDMILARKQWERRNERDDYAGPHERQAREGQDVDELERKADLYRD